MKLDGVGAVCIGRNEGERLRRCLESLVGRVAVVVYVDSGSTDGSVTLAESLGAEVVALDMSVPFTAARARNAGYRRLKESKPDIAYVQFVDGDCAVIEAWLERAVEHIASNDRFAVVCGRRIERSPESSVYNRLCDLEWRWNAAYGEIDAFGGDALVRAAAFDEVDGLDESLIAGEEPEFCFRLRERGWIVYRIDCDMTLHDAAMTRFGQWWKRAERAGHASAEAAWMHGASPERYGVRPTVSAWIWAIAVPISATVMSVVFFPWGLLSFAAYPLLAGKTAWFYARRGMRASDAALYAVNCVAAKFPNVRGHWTFFWKRIRGKRSTLIEYK